MYRPVGIRGFDMKEHSRRFATEAGEDNGLVQQQFKEEVDINNIMKRFSMTGVPPVMRDGGMYGDFTQFGDYREMLDKIRNAEERFMRLPPQTREVFENDPSKLVAYAQSVDEGDFVKLFDGEVKKDVLEAVVAPVAAVVAPEPVKPA